MLRGEVDAIATDHAPHTAEEKEKGAPGMVGLETAFGVCYTKLCREHGMSLEALSRMMSARPAEIMGLNQGLLKPGMKADLVMVAGKSKNTPFDGVTLWGSVCRTVKSGRTVYEKTQETNEQ